MNHTLSIVVADQPGELSRIREPANAIEFGKKAAPKITPAMDSAESHASPPRSR